MAFLRVVGLVVGTALIQSFLPVLLPGLGAVDLLMLVVVHFALELPFRRGVLAGALAGLAQDSLSAGLAGLHAFTKTLVAAVVGLMGDVVVIQGTVPRAVLIGLAEVAEALLVVGLLALVDRPSLLEPGRIATQAAATAAAAAAFFSLAGVVRRWWRRRRKRRR